MKLWHNTNKAHLTIFIYQKFLQKRGFWCKGSMCKILELYFKDGFIVLKFLKRIKKKDFTDLPENNVLYYTYRRMYMHLYFITDEINW